AGSSAIPAPYTVLTLVGHNHQVEAKDKIDVLRFTTEISQYVRSGKSADRLTFLPPVSPPTLMRLGQEIEEIKPDIIHIIAHGEGDNCLMYLGADKVEPSALAARLCLACEDAKPKAILLSVCHSSSTFDTLKESADILIGAEGLINIIRSTHYVSAFFRNLSEGRTFRQCHQRALMHLEGQESSITKLPAKIAVFPELTAPVWDSR
ncbi:MAG: hypothetical protein Q8M03_14285, partial [Legionella sp.]|nr:hypothetical protein [Legionella sp.]